MKGIFLLLGSNLGDKVQNLETAIEKLSEKGVILTDYSSVYETAPWGNLNQDWFLNMVIRVDTVQTPEELLRTCQRIELEMGRVRIEKWGARMIDIDLLFYDNAHLETQELTLPHPGIPDRRFTLEPMSELAPQELHPVSLLSIKELLQHCHDTSACRKTDLLLKL